jgi:hypothetical protein
MPQKSAVETSTSFPENSNNPPIQADVLLQALTVGKESLYAIIQDSQEDVLLAALRNPALDQQHVLALLKRRTIAQVISAIYTCKRLIEAHSVKFALVAHPDTPVHIAQTLLPLLYIFDLLKLCLIPGISADLRLAAERRIVQQIPAQPLGNKLTLARRGTATIVDALLREGILTIVEACLDNPHLKEGALYQFLTSFKANAEAIAMIARNNRWKNRPNIRLAILKNPHTPLPSFTSLLPGLQPATRRDLLASPRLTSAQKEQLRQIDCNFRP